MIKVISFRICPFVQRVTALLAAKGIAHDLDYIRLSDKPDWFLEISPNGQVPVLITENGRALFESDAIVEYLEEVFPPLQPDISPEDRAVHRAWSYLASKNYLVQCSLQRSSDAGVLEERHAELRKAFDKIERRLGHCGFFNGDALGMVDIAWLVLLHRAEIIQRHAWYDVLDGYPKMKKWQKEILATGIAGKSVAEDFEKAFCEFYLSDKTFLGRRAARDNRSSSKACATDNCC